MTLRSKVIFSILKRNFLSYFSGVLGYLFIGVFVVVGAVMAFNPRFFTANEPNLDQLTAWYPLLLLFFIPAVTMSVWADERKTGTDELLFTMPATDLEILLGKYLSVLAVYTVALLFSTTYVFVLMWLGNPDWGLLATTYFGYWIAGAALLSAGMLASILTRSLTVAFVLGVLLCGIPIFIEYLGTFGPYREFFESLSLREQFRDFGMGIVTFTGLLYFIGFAVFMLYLNLVLMTRRHWSSSKRAGMGVQFSVRTLCLAMIIICITSWAGYAALRVDATSEQLFSLSPVTRKVLNGLDSDRPIQIQAFLSPEVPREYVETRKRLVGLLRQFDETGGKNLEVRFVDVTPFSKEAEEAERFGIQPVPVFTERDGRRSEEEIYLGAVVLSSYDKVVVPFFGKGLPIEYELTRSLQTVAQKERHKVGVLTTDVGLLSGGNEWQIVTELKKQYEVEEVSPDAPIDASSFDVLIAAMPSSLTDPQMDNLVNYVKGGNPILVFDDPFPLTFPTGAPSRPKPSPGGHMGMMMGRQPPPEPKADGGRATRLLRALGIEWEYDEVVFDFNNPHPEFAALLTPEQMIITRDSGNTEAFNPDNPITKGLEEMIVMYSGEVKPRDDDDDIEFEPLLVTGPDSGVLGWDDFVEEGGFDLRTFSSTLQPRRDPPRETDRREHVIAARVKSKDLDADDEESSDESAPARAGGVNGIFVGDIDVILDFFFQERSQGNLDIQFDNVTFVLNAVDMLAGDESVIELRSRRPRHRTLKRVEEQKREFLKNASKAEQKAEEQAKEALEAREAELQKRVQEIVEDENMDELAKAQALEAAQQAEQRRMDIARLEIEQEKDKEIRKVDAATNRQIRNMEKRIRTWSVVFSPLPAIILGVVMLIQRQLSERRSVTDRRRRH